jgi:hypothetical protein
MEKRRGYQDPAPVPIGSGDIPLVTSNLFSHSYLMALYCPQCGSSSITLETGGYVAE